MSSSMLEQAIIDAKELKESAQRNAEEAIVEKYQLEIKEAVEKILEQEDPLGLGGGLGDMDAGLGATTGKPESAMQPDPGKDQINMVLEQLPFLQTTDDNQVVELDLAKLEESLNIVNEEEFELSEDLLEEFGLEEEMLDEEDLPVDRKTIEQLAAAEIKRMAAEKEEGSMAMEEDLSLEEMIAEALEEMLGEEDVLEEDEDLFEEEDLEEKQASTEKYNNDPALKGDQDKLPDALQKGIIDAAAQNESKKLQRENKTLIKEQTRMSSKVQLLEEKLDKYGTVIDQLKQKLDESNLASAKLLYQNRVLDSASLNERQKNRIVEAIKDADSVEEAKIIFETLQSTVETTGKSGRKKESLDEVVYRGSSAFMPLKEDKQKVSDPFVARMQALAGLK